MIVITGDHGRMDTSLVEGVNNLDRTIYNCFINADGADTAFTVGRVFTPMDMYPTVLSALGFSIQGERLALGTNLFSGKRTLAEEKGFANFNRELGLSSESYTKLFAPELLSSWNSHAKE